MKRIAKKSKGSYQHGSLKLSLLEAAIASITKHGKIEFSLRELARMVGVTPMAVYKHYESKEAILLEIAKEGFAKLGSSFRSALADDPQDLRAIGKAYIEFARRHSVYFRIMFHPDLQKAIAHQKAESLDLSPYDILVDCIDLNQKKSCFRQGSKDALAVTAWSTVHGLACLIVDGNLANVHPEIQTDQLIEDTTSLVIEGFLR